MRNNYADNDALAKFEDTQTASGAGAAIVEIAASEDEFWCIDWISWSYDADPTAGSLKIEIGGTTVWWIDITSGGPGHIEFVRPIYTELRRDGGQPKLNEIVKVTLADGTVANKVNVRYR